MQENWFFWNEIEEKERNGSQKNGHQKLAESSQPFLNRTKKSLEQPINDQGLHTHISKRKAINQQFFSVGQQLFGENQCFKQVNGPMANIGESTN